MNDLDERIARLTDAQRRLLAARLGLTEQTPPPDDAVAIVGMGCGPQPLPDALDDAGIPATSLAGTDTGVYRSSSDDPSGDLDLRGPNIATDDSLVALHLACQSIRAGESDMALVGGVSAVVVLKRLSAAVRDGDPIWAVVRGTAVGRTDRPTVIRRAWDRAGMAPEPHGAGPHDLVGVIRTALSVRRHAGVSSFGPGAAVAHAVLAPAPPVVSPAPSHGPRMVVVTARTSEAVTGLAEAYASGLGELALADVAHTLLHRRDLHPFRAAVVADTEAEAAAALRDVTPIQAFDNPAVVLVFPDQGDLPDLSIEDPAYREAVAECEAEFRTATRHAEHFTVQVGLAAMWVSWGLRPTAVVGHGLGEVAAAYVAGALSLPDAVRIVAAKAGLGEDPATAIAPREPRIPFLTTDPYPDDAYWTRSTPPEFELPDALASVECFVEVSPHPALVGTINATHPHAVVVGSLAHGEPPHRAMLTSAARLLTAGVPLSAKALAPGGRPIHLPPHPAPDSAEPPELPEPDPATPEQSTTEPPGQALTEVEPADLVSAPEPAMDEPAEQGPAAPPPSDPDLTAQESPEPDPATDEPAEEEPAALESTGVDPVRPAPEPAAHESAAQDSAALESTGVGSAALELSALEQSMVDSAGQELDPPDMAPPAPAPDEAEAAVESRALESAALEPTELVDPGSPAPAPDEAEPAALEAPESEPVAHEAPEPEPAPEPTEVVAPESSELEHSLVESAGPASVVPEPGALEPTEQDLAVLEPDASEPPEGDPSSQKASAREVLAQEPDTQGPDTQESSDWESAARDSAVLDPLGVEPPEGESAAQALAPVESAEQEVSAQEPDAQKPSDGESGALERSTVEPAARDSAVVLESTGVEPPAREPSAPEPFEGESGAREWVDVEPAGLESATQERSGLEPFEGESGAQEWVDVEPAGLESATQERPGLEPFDGESGAQERVEMESTVLESAEQEVAALELPEPELSTVESADPESGVRGVPALEAIDEESELTGLESAALVPPPPEMTGLETVVRDAPPAGVDRFVAFPLSPHQKMCWAGRGQARHYVEYLTADVDLERLEFAWNRLVRRHEMLRAVVDPDGRQRILPDVPHYPIEFADQHDTGERDASGWPLFDVHATRAADGVHIHLAVDMVVCDGRGLGILSDEWQLLYREPDVELPPLRLSFRDVALTLDQTADEYVGPPSPGLPLVREAEASAVRRRSARVDRWARLQERAADAGVSPGALLLAAYTEVLGTWSATPEFRVDVTTFALRAAHPGGDDVVGDFASTVPVAVDAMSAATFRERAQAIQHRVTEADQRSADSPYLFTSLLTDEAPFGWLGRRVHSVASVPGVLVHLQVTTDRGELVLDVDTVDDRFPPGLADALVDSLVSLVRELADADWDRPPLSLVPRAQLTVRQEANRTDAPVPAGGLHEPFVRTARREPDRIALRSAARTLTYGELDRASEYVADRLTDTGIGRGHVVAVTTRKGWEQVVAVLGTLKAGAAYVPVDPDLPAERRRHLLDRTRAAAVLTQVGIPDDGPPAFVIDGVGTEPRERPATAGDDVAYVTPQSVVVHHRAALNTVLDINSRFAVGPTDAVLALSSLSVDRSVYDLFGTLAAGATLVVPDARKQHDPDHWADLVATHGVTLWNSVPALYGRFLDHLAGSPAPGLRHILLSGDWIPLSLPERSRAVAPDAALTSLGGAPEAAVWSISHPIGEPDPTWPSIPYGRPLTNQRLHVVNAAGAPCPDWVPGELRIAGVGVALGYLGDDDRTRAAFPVDRRTGERHFRTGDVGRYRPDGTIEILGRAERAEDETEVETDDETEVAGPSRAALPPEGTVPLLPIQRWFLELDLAEPAHFAQTLTLEPVDGPLDPDRLAAAVTAAFGRHDALRLRFGRTGVTWTQYYAAEPGVVVEQQPAGAPVDPAAGLDLTDGPLARAVVVTDDSDDTGAVGLLVAAHQLVVDGVSWQVLLDDVAAAYAGAPLPPVSTGFGDYATALVDHADRPEVAGNAAAWAERLDGVTPAGPAGPERDAVTIARSFDDITTAELLTRAGAAYRTSVDELLLTALARTLRGPGGGPLRVDLEHHGRTVPGLPDVSGTVGWFTTVTPVALTVDPALDHGDAIVAVKESVRALPGGAEVLHADWPRAQIMLTYRGGPDGLGGGLLRVATGAVARSSAPGNRRPWALEIDCRVLAGRFHVTWTYDRERHSPAAEQMLDRFVAELDALVRHCVTPGAGRHTPSDFPLAALSDETLASVIDQFRRANQDEETRP